MPPRPFFRLLTALFVLAAGFVLAPGPSARAASATPPFKIGYLESGPYWTSTQTLAALKNELAERGWQDRVEFVPDARYSPGWNSGAAALEEAARALMDRRDLNLVLVMGTRATRALLAANHGTTPIIGLDITDPVRAGLVKNPQESGVANFTTIIQQDHWTDMFHLFHEAVGFKNLGMLMAKDPDGLVLSNLDAAREVARDRGFRLQVYADIEDPSSSLECQRGIDALIDQGIDALFLPILPCIDIDNLHDVLEKLNRHKIATFASEGSLLIKQGALMGASTHNFSVIGEISASMVIAILQGKSPASLQMLHRVPPAIGLNLDTAGEIGITFPFQLLSVCDEIYCRLSP